jgi:hypothetical protein
MPSAENDYLKKVLRLFLTVSLPIALVLSVVANWKVGLVFGGLIGLFAAVHLGRNMMTESFEINSSNKDKTKGLSWYEQEIISYMRDLRYRNVLDTHQIKIWQPPVRAQVMGGEFKMEVTPYSITMTGTKGQVRILKSILDLDKIFL